MLRKSIKRLFPESVPVYHPPSSEYQHRDKKLVFIAGWGGAKRTSLSKVIRYYNSKGYGVVSHTMTYGIPGFVRDAIEELVAEEINRQMTHTGSRGLISHLFSNNGAWLYSSLNKKQLIPTCDLVIWDSGPGVHKDKAPVVPLAVDFARTAYSFWKKQPVYDHPIFVPVTTAAIASFLWMCRGIMSLQGNRHLILDVAKLNRYLYHESPIVPSIFISSTGDVLISPSRSLHFADHFYERGAPVATKLFGDDVHHTGSFYLKTKEYTEYLESFLEDGIIHKHRFKSKHHK